MMTLILETFFVCKNLLEISYWTTALTTAAALAAGPGVPLFSLAMALELHR